MSLRDTLDDAEFPVVDAQVTVNFVGVGEAGPVAPITCQSRTGVPKQASALAGLPHDLQQILFAANGRFLVWLQASPENLELFSRDPVNALRHSGVELTRDQQKQLLRLRDGQTSPPGALPGLPSGITMRYVSLSPSESAWPEPPDRGD